MIARTVFLLALWITASRIVQPADDSVPVLTVCEALMEPDRYDGKSVVIVRRFSATSEGSWLDEECGLTVMNAGHEFSPIISTTYIASQVEQAPRLPSHFRWDRRLLLEKRDEVRKSTQLRFLTDRWAAEFGGSRRNYPGT